MTEAKDPKTTGAGPAGTEVAARYGRVAAGFGARLAGVSGSQWDTPTPCADWTVRDLVAHVVGVHRRVLAALDGGQASEADTAGDLVGQWSEATAGVAAALGDPERAARTVGGMFGEQPFEDLVSRLLCSDTLFHTWDLARATGQDEQLDPGAVSRAMEFLAPVDEAIRRPGGFAPKIEPPAGADEQTRLLCFGGRAVL